MHTTVNSSTVSPTTLKLPKNADSFPPAIEYLLITIYVIVVLVGIFGNGLVCYLFASKKVKRKPFNVLLLNLSIADLLADLFVIPYISVNLKLLRHLSSKYANLACAFTIGLTPFWVVTCSSLLSLCFISLTRYLQVKRPVAYTRVTSRRGIAIFIVMSYIIGLGSLAPNLFSFKYEPETGVCHRAWPKGFHGVAYSAATAAVAVVLPTVSMVFTFVSTTRTLWKLSVNEDNDDGSLRQPLLASTVESRKNAIKLLGGLIIVFIVCWCPFFIYWVLSRAVPPMFSKGVEGDYTRMKVIRLCILAAVCNTIADPLLYVLRIEEFRRGIKDTVRGFSSGVFGRRLSSIKGQGNARVKELKFNAA